MADLRSFYMYDNFLRTYTDLLRSISSLCVRFSRTAQSKVYHRNGAVFGLDKLPTRVQANEFFNARE